MGPAILWCSHRANKRLDRLERTVSQTNRVRPGHLRLEAAGEKTSKSQQGADELLDTLIRHPADRHCKRRRHLATTFRWGTPIPASARRMLSLICSICQRCTSR